MKTIDDKNRVILEFLLGTGEFRVHQPFKDSYNYFQEMNREHGVWITISSSKEKGGMPALSFHSSWGHLIQAYQYFLRAARHEFNTESAMRISYCANFIDGINNDSIEDSFNALVEGIETLNKRWNINR